MTKRAKVTPKPKTGRPLAKIDPKQVEQLAAIDCSYAEMAAVLGCDPATLTRRFAQVIEKGRASGRGSLKRMQFKLAMEGDRTMLVWLGKVRLGQKEMHVVESRDVSKMSDDELAAERKRIGLA